MVRGSRAADDHTRSAGSSGSAACPKPLVLLNKTCTFHKKSLKSSLLIRWPLLVRGARAAGLSHRWLFSNHRSCFQLSAFCCKAVYRAQKCADLPSPPLLQLPEIYQFSTHVSREEKTRKTALKPSKKTKKIHPEIHKNKIGETVFYVIPYSWKPG